MVAGQAVAPALAAPATQGKGPAAPSNTYQVTNTNDSGAGSLRQAIFDANASLGADTITFNIPGSGVKTISPIFPLPAITDPVTLDGTTQSGYAGTPLVELNGSSAGAVQAGLVVSAGNSTVRGLAINNFNGAGIKLDSSGNNTIAGNYIGTDTTGTLSRPNLYGILVQGVPTNTIGGTTPAARNLISGNAGEGIIIQLSGASGNKVQGNYIGTDVTGTADLGNNGSGVLVQAGAATVTVGGTTTGAGNLISGNNGPGIAFNGTNGGGYSSVVQGNYIGTNAAGNAALGNGGAGIYIFNFGIDITIGGTDVAARNVISGNGSHGIHITPGSANDIYGNYIGTDATGTVALGNNGNGVFLDNAIGTTLGGSLAGARNLISGNKGSGVVLQGSDTIGTSIRNNYIGTDVSGTVDLGNTLHGVVIASGSDQNLIGGSSATSRNLISGNDGSGIVLNAAGSLSNRIVSNFIGTNISGTADLGNSGHGVLIDSTSNVTLGDLPLGNRNLISGNDQAGVIISGTLAHDNKVQNNYVGTNISGTAAIGNIYGIEVRNAPTNTIGRSDYVEGRNLISGNYNGIFITGSGSTSNLVQGNYIGTDVTGTYAVSGTNGTAGGVLLLDGAKNNTIGGGQALARNLISGNGYGVLFQGSTTANNKVQNNYIGTAADGTSPLGNLYGGVRLSEGSGNMIGGGVGLGNTIAYNGYHGVSIGGGTGNVIYTNSIFANAQLGINLGYDSVTANDPLDADTGGNNLQNFPVLSAASTATEIKGSLNSTASTTFTIELFTNTTCNPLGYGEGRTFIGSTSATTLNNGNGSFTFSPDQALPGGSLITATATDPNGNTSEFSACFQLPGAPTATATATNTATSTATKTATSTATSTTVANASATATATKTATKTATNTATNTATSTTVANSSATATATATKTPVKTATSTSVPASSTPATPSATATVPPSECNIQFSDVPAGSTFYQYVQCLACRGILGGYADGTFRSNADVTRGQLSKIVANAVGFDEPVSGQTFTDVTPDSPFYSYIERMVGRDVIGGYADGTFRPNNNATRGQVAKIVSNAFFPNCQASAGAVSVVEK
jgi:titin